MSELRDISTARPPLVYDWFVATRDMEANPGLYMRTGWRRAVDTIDHQLKRYTTAPVRLRANQVLKRAVWRDCRGAYRIGRTDDMTQMLADLGINDRAW